MSGRFGLEAAIALGRSRLFHFSPRRAEADP